MKTFVFGTEGNKEVKATVRLFAPLQNDGKFAKNEEKFWESAIPGYVSVTLLRSNVFTKRNGIRDDLILVETFKGHFCVFRGKFEQKFVVTVRRTGYHLRN